MASFWHLEAYGDCLARFVHTLFQEATVDETLIPFKNENASSFVFL